MRAISAWFPKPAALNPPPSYPLPLLHPFLPVIYVVLHFVHDKATAFNIYNQYGAGASRYFGLFPQTLPHRPPV